MSVAASTNRRGMIALSVAMAAYAINDTCVKLVARTLPIGETIFLRGILSVLMLAAAVMMARAWPKVVPSARAPVLWRGLFDALGTVCFVAALVHMNMAELSAMVMVSPLIITAIAALLFSDPVGWRRWSAIAVGLAGALMIVKPDLHALDVWALLGLSAALFAACRDLITRRIHPAIPSLVVSLYGALAVMASGAVLGLAESWRMPDPLQWLGIVVAAIFLGLGTYLVVLAFRGVEIPVVAPFRYTLLLWMGLSAYFVFGELPDRWSLAGAVLIAAGGLYTLHREAVRRRELAARALPPA